MINKTPISTIFLSLFVSNLIISARKTSCISNKNKIKLINVISFLLMYTVHTHYMSIHTYKFGVRIKTRTKFVHNNVSKGKVRFKCNRKIMHINQTCFT